MASPVTSSSTRSRWLRGASIGACLAVILITAVGCKARTAPIDTSSSAPAVESPSAAATSAPPGKSLLALKGTGDMKSDPFSASGDSVQVTYAFTCATPGPFTLNFYGTNGSPVLPDVLVDDFGDKGGDTTTEGLNGATGPFQVEVVSACDWSVEVNGAP